MAELLRLVVEAIDCKFTDMIGFMGALLNKSATVHTNINCFYDDNTLV